MRKSYIIVDVDGTVADCEHRNEFALTGQWDAFQDLCHLDKPYQDVADLVKALDVVGLTIIGLTGRTERIRLLTQEWLQRHDILFDELIMRANTDFSKSSEFKIAALERRFGSKEEVLEAVLFVLEDNDKVVEALRDYGLSVLQPRPGSAY